MFRFWVRDVFGRARLETDWAEGGRMPVPTLAEKEEFEVDLEEAELLRYD